MAWLVIAFGTILFLIGIAGQFFGLTKRTLGKEDRRAGVMVLRIVCAVAGLWLVFISAAHVAHLQFSGRW